MIFKNIQRTFLAGLFTLGICASMHSQLTVDPSITAQDGVQNILMGGGVVASNITFGGVESSQIGTFECNGCGINLASGLILGSGAVTGAIGPNTSGSFNASPPSGSDGFGDPDLAALAGNTINNAAILEFDFVPNGDEIAFNFVFSSEEYPEYVFNINDAFGFFISGPGINGPFTNNAENIALIPNTSLPITINSVNAQVNTEYYIANHNPDNTLATFYNVQADAFTTVLTAQSTVQCGETYHIKIAIGDASDGNWDSWVFLEEGSFSSAPLNLAFVQPTLAPENENGMYEDCGQAPLTFFRPPCTFGDYTINLTYSGSAINGSDIETLPASITIPDGEDSFVLMLNPVNDGEAEDVENLVFNTQLILADGSTIDIQFELLIYDHPGLALSISPDDNNVCPDAPVVLTANPSNTVGDITYLWSNGATTQTITVSSFATAQYSVIVTDGCGYTIEEDHTVDVLPFTQPLTVPASVFHLCTGIPSGPVIHGGIAPYTFNYDESVIEIINGSGFLSNAGYAMTEVEIIDVCGNTANIEMSIYPCDTTIPNVFTPNNDSSNPRFTIKGIEAFPNSTLLVYNRWGKIVFESNNYQNTWSATDQEDGNYYYIFKRSDGQDYAGHLQIVR